MVEQMKNYEAITQKYARSIPDLSQTKWNKLMFFTDGASFCLRGITFSNFQYIKMPYGPVPNNYRDIIQEMQTNGTINVSTNLDISDAVRIIKPPMELNLEMLDNFIEELDSEFRIVDRIISVFGRWTAVQLSDFSHLLDAWIRPSIYSNIDLSSLREDSFLKEEFSNGNFGEVLFK